MIYKPDDILNRLADSSPNESSHELQCRFFDAAEEISRLRAKIADIEKIMHYPECWDTAAYPTLLDSIIEVFKCSECGKKP